MLEVRTHPQEDTGREGKCDVETHKNRHDLWENKDCGDICIIDQTLLPHSFEIINITNVKQTAKIILDMNFNNF